nr:hypothetical protein [Tanacetum cinerariifolium]
MSQRPIMCLLMSQKKVGSIDIKETDDDKRTESDNEDQAMDDAEKNNDDKAEEDTNQEPIQYDQAKYEVASVFVSMTHKEKPKLLISTYSQYVSSNYGSSKGGGLIPEVLDEPKANYVSTNVSEESWGNDSDTEKS